LSFPFDALLGFPQWTNSQFPQLNYCCAIMNHQRSTCTSVAFSTWRECNKKEGKRRTEVKTRCVQNDLETQAKALFEHFSRLLSSQNV
jgi:hypothetical protein